MLTDDSKHYLECSILCWLATVDAEGCPNVSPKEIFTYDAADDIWVAQLASPQSARNIRRRPAVCLSFIDVFVQKGYKIKGTARLVAADDPAFSAQAERLRQLAGPDFPFREMIGITPTQIEPIVAPSYRFRPATTELAQVRNALQTYGVREWLTKVEQL